MSAATEPAADAIGEALTEVYRSLPHPDLPADVVFMVAGRPPSPWCIGLDHPAARHAAVPLEDLSDPEHTMTHILHASAHLLAGVRRAKVVTRQGRYHNLMFDALLGELVDGPHGAAPGAPCAATIRQLFPASVGFLSDVLTPGRVEAARTELRPAPGRSSNLSKATCGCDRIIRASHAVLDGPPIMCLACDQPFRAVTG